MFTRVRENGEVIGSLPNGRYFVLDLEPGVHSFETSTGDKDNLRLQVDAGEVYYLSATLAPGLALAKFGLTPSDKTAFETAAKNMSRAN